MAKAKDAFRTISEVAEWLDTPTHVLRFWERKFAQIKPVKGAGGRRYYRPTDIELISGIKQLLHEDGLTIKGTQKLMREKGVKYIASLGKSFDPDAAAAPEPVAAPAPPPPAPKPRKIEPVKWQEPVQNAFLFDNPELPAAAPEQEQDTLDTVEVAAPASVGVISSARPRLLGRMTRDSRKVRKQAAVIIPLLERLEKIREKMDA